MIQLSTLKKSGLTLALLLITLISRAQLSGTITVPSVSYPDLATVISALNTTGVSGAVTINLNAGQTAPTGGYLLGSTVLNASVSSSNTITINGNGNTITAPAGTVSLSTTLATTNSLHDDIFGVAGTDYITFNNIIFAEPSTNNTITLAMEAALAFYNLNTTGTADGCQNITVNNCTFNMTKYGQAGAAIVALPMLYNSSITSTWTLMSDRHRDFNITNNNFASVYSAFFIRGISGNTIRNVNFLNNTVTNMGGLGTASGANTVTSYGVYPNQVDSLKMNGNNISLSNVHVTTAYAAYNGSSLGGYVETKNNTITLQTGTTTSQTSGIYFSSMIGGNFEMTGNVLQFGTSPVITTGIFYGLYATYGGGGTNVRMNLSNNTCLNQTIPGNGTKYLIYQSHAYNLAGSTTVMANNNISGNTFTGYGTVYGIRGGYSMVDSLYNNTINNNTFTYTATGTTYFYCLYPYAYYAGDCQVYNNSIQNNTINNNTLSSSAYLYALYNYPAYAGTLTANVGAVKVFNNTIANLTIQGTSTSASNVIYGLYNYNYGATVPMEIYNNTLKNITMGSNTTSNTGTVYGFYLYYGNGAKVYNNLLNNITAYKAANIQALSVLYGDNYNIYNNFITDLSTPNATNSSTSITGLNLLYVNTANSPFNVSYNTIKFGSATATSTGTGYGASGIYWNAGSLNLKNNIINVQGIATGTGTIVAIRKSAFGTAGVKPTGFQANNNIYYVNPVANNFLYAEGTSNLAGSLKNAYGVSGNTANPTNNIVNDALFNSSCGLYTTAFMGSSDDNAFAEDNLTAGSVVGTYVPTGASYAQNSGIAVAGITNDFSLATRNTTTPDLGALEFTGTSIDAAAPTIALTALPNFACTSVPSQSVAITDLSGVNVTAGTKPRLYYKRATDNNTILGNTSSDNGWKFIEASNSVSPFNFTFDFSLLFAATTAPYIATGDVIQYFVVAQDLNSTVNVGVNGATLFAGFCPSSVALPLAAFPVSNTNSFAITPASTVLVTSSPNPVCQNTATTLTAALTTSSNILPTGYAASNATSNFDDEILNVSLGTGGNIINNTSSCATTGGAAGNGLPNSVLNMYSNFTTTGLTVPSIASGQTIPFSLTLGYCNGSAYGMGYSIFIDYNRNGVFESNEKVAGSTTTTTYPVAGGPATGTFTVPSNVAMGYTLLRIVAIEANASPAATGTYTWGETEDYIVNLQGSPATISWQAGTTIVGTTNPLTIVPTGSTNYIANVVDANGCSFIGGTSVTVNPAPSAPTATNSLQCGTQVPTASVASTAGTAGSGTMNWFSASTGGTLMQGNAYGPLSTYYANDFSNLTFANSFVTGLAAISAGQLVLNPNTTAQFGGLQVNATGVNTNKQQIDFDLTTQGLATTNMADGFSFSYGDDATAANTPPNAENGSGTKLKIGFVYYTNGTSTQGTYLMYNCTTDEQSPITSGVLAYNNSNLSYLMSTKHVTINIDSTGLLNMTLGGAPIFTNVQLPAAFVNADKSNWAYVFKARSGGIPSGTIIDNVQIQTGAIVPGYTTYKSPISTTTTFYVSETGTNGCASTRTPVTATVNIPDLLTASASNAINVCVNTPITLSVAKTGTANTYAYTWYATPATGSGVSATGLTAPTNGTVTVTPTTAGTYVYTIGGFDGSVTPTCATTANISVNVVDPWNGFAATINPSTLGICNGNAATLTSVINGPQTFPIGYPTCNATATGDEEILNVSLGTSGSLLNNTSDCSTVAGGAGNGLPGSSNQLYSNYTTVSTVAVPSLATGATIPWSLTLGYCSGFAYPAGYSIYIDFNRNGVFTDAGEKVAGSTTTTTYAVTGSAVTGSFTVPANATPGKTIMRVVYAESIAAPASTGTFTWGEAEDYAVNISSNPATLTWNEGATVLGTTPVLTYNSSVVGPHTINYTATSAVGGCILNSSNAVVTINAIPSAPSISNSIQCGTKVPTNTATSTAGALGSGTFKWYTAPTGGTPIETTTTGNLVNYQVATTTTLYVSEMSVAGCESARSPFLVTVNPIDPIFASASATANVCVNTPVALNVTKTGNLNTYVYNWTATPQVNSGLSVAGSAAALNTPIVTTPTAAGTYAYKVTGIETATGCAVTSTVNVTVIDPWNGYTAFVAPSTASICNGNNVSLSAFVLGNQTLPTGYCSVTNAGYACIGNVTFNTLNNTTACAAASPYYTDYPTSVATTNVAPGQTYTLSISSLTDAVYTTGAIVSVWFDWNRNGVFEATEWYQPFISGFSGSVQVTVPVNASMGLTKMRVRSRGAGNINGATDACTAMGSGETEDYSINIASANAASFAWKENGATIGTTNPLSYTGTVGTHYVSFTAASAQGCLISSQPATVNVLALPSAPTAANSAHCGTKIPTATVTKTSGVNGTGTFNWYTTATGTTTAQVGTSNTFTSMISTTTTFYVSEVGVNGCESARTPVTITVTPADAITASASNTTNLCINTPVNLTVAQTGTNNTYLYTWSATPQAGSGIGVNGIAGLATTPTTVTPSAAGTITYTVVGNQNGPAIYSNLAASSTVDEDCGNVTITQGATTILNNTSLIGSLLGSIGTATGLPSQRADYTAFGPYTLNANGTYSLSVSSITSGAYYYNGMGVYIDYNRNGSFADAGETVYASTTTILGPHTETATFTVPATALNGLTRMRVIVNEGTVATPESAPIWGEVEEYAINLVTPNIGGGNPTTGCTVYSSVNVNVINPWVGITASVTPTTANICGLGTPVTLTGSAGGPTTLPTGYAASSAIYTSDEEILNVSLGTAGSLLNNSSTCATTAGPAGNGLAASVNQFYSNYTTVPTIPIPSLAPGATIPYAIKLGYCGTYAYSNIAAIYIDYNRNGVFGAGEQVAVTNYGARNLATGDIISGTFTVPTTASAGRTLMRVVYVESSVVNPTGTYGWGETEDYAVMIGTSAASQTWTEATTTLGTNTTLAYTPTSFGTKTITYTAADANGCTISANATLNVSQPAAPTVANVSLCQNSTATALTATALTGHTVNWYTSATGGTALASAPIPSTATAGTTTYYATQTTPQGCESLRTPLVVTVNPAPTFTSATTIAPVCNQTAIAYTPTSSTSGATFAWSRASVSGIANAAATGTGAINENLNNTTANPVTVTYVYTTTNPTSGCTNTNNVTATVNPAATLSSASAAPAVCNNNVFAYTPSSATAGTTFAWSRATVTGISNAAGNGTGAINETLINTTANPITVTYNYVLTANGCNNNQSVTVVVNPSATMSSSLTANVCSGRSFKYTPLSATASVAYAWSRATVAGISNTTASGTGAINETLVNTTQAPINVTYVYTLTANGCTNTQNLVVTVNPTPAKLVITADGPTVFCKEESVVLRFNPLNTGTYQWYQDGVPVSGATATNTLVTTAGSFTAIVTNSFGCASDPSTAMVVEVPCEIGISLPDIFTPNGDGSNDKIKPVVPGIHTFSFFRVYNRWGNLVFESTDPNAAWDGSYKGEMQPQDSYSYVIEGYNFRMELIRKQGTITLVR